MKYEDADRIVNAVYTEQELEEYNNNPLIEALPDIFTEDDLMEKFTIYPTVNPNDCQKPAHIRFHMIQRLKHYTIPWGVHRDLERNISSMLRRGYMSRNPVNNLDFQNRLFAINQQVEQEVDKDCFNTDQLNDIQSSALTLSLIGISGIGKTTAIERLLKMYPQVIRHTKYNNVDLVRDQVVWIKLDCPFDGSLKTFCQSFFKAVDDVLGTRYYDKFGNARNSRGKMMIDMERIATIHSIGIIAIDEMQHLIKSRTDPEELLNFLVTLENKIGVPLVLIGTFKVLEVLTKELRQSRRATSQSSIIWDRMNQGPEWNLFTKLLWKLQWLKNPTPYNQKFEDLIYEESQGITAIAVNLFLLSQVRALDTEDEKITEKIIRDTAKKDLFMVRKIIEALKNNDIDNLKNYEDVAADLNTIIRDKGETIVLQNKIKEHANSLAQFQKIEKRTKVEIITIEITAMNMFANLSFKDIEEVVTSVVTQMGIKEDDNKLKREAVKEALHLDEQKADKKRKKAQMVKQKVDKEGLTYLYKKATADKKHIYELLDESGYIKNSKEFTI
ncbi:MAG: ATP-binding protein [Fermentimonas sp.]|nr:ATP-binding protein [Fermentimonas sp.]